MLPRTRRPIYRRALLGSGALANEPLICNTCNVPTPFPAGRPISAKTMCFLSDPRPFVRQTRAANATRCNINSRNRAPVAWPPAPQKCPITPNIATWKMSKLQRGAVGDRGYRTFIVFLSQLTISGFQCCISGARQPPMPCPPPSMVISSQAVPTWRMASQNAVD